MTRSRYVRFMRLSAYPFVIVRIGCSTCSRKGQYRLARLADRYGAEVEMNRLLGMLAADCKLRDPHRPAQNVYCRAHFIDLAVPRPPDLPTALKLLRAVK